MKILEITKKICFIISGICLTFMFLLVTAEVIDRSIIGNSLLIVDETIGYLMLPIVFFGGIIALDENKFIRVSVLYDHFSPKVKHVLNICFYILFLIYNGLCLYYCFLAMATDFSFGTVSGSLLKMPLWIPKATIVIGLLIMEIYLITRIVTTIKRKEEIK